MFKFCRPQGDIAEEGSEEGYKSVQMSEGNFPEGTLGEQICKDFLLKKMEGW